MPFMAGNGGGWIAVIWVVTGRGQSRIVPRVGTVTRRLTHAGELTPPGR
ncbi:hypothetical protein ABIE69_001267 [Rhodobacteraceae bacterium MBR-64]|jgi:hypothetical protein